MGNTFSSRHGPKGKTLELETPPGRHTLPVHEVRLTDTRPVDLLPCPDSLKGGFEQEFSKLKDELKAKVIDYQDAIQPHTDEGGEAYYIGDAYEDVTAKYAAEWRVDELVVPFACH